MSKIRQVMKDLWQGIKSGSGKLIPRRLENLTRNLTRRPGERVVDVKEVTTDKERAQTNFTEPEHASRPAPPEPVMPSDTEHVSSVVITTHYFTWI